MKKVYLIFLCLCFSFLLFGQGEKDIRFGVSVQPHVSNGLLDGSKMEAPYPFGFALRFDLTTVLWKKLEFNTGLAYQSSAIAERDYSLSFACDFNPGTLEVDGKNSYVESNYRFHFINIPLELKYNFSERENHFYSKAGMHSMIKFADKKSTAVVECGNASSITLLTLSKNLRSTVLSLSAGIGYQFKLPNQHLGFIEPTANYGLTDIFQNTDNDPDFKNSRMHNFGLRTGIWF